MSFDIDKRGTPKEVVESFCHFMNTGQIAALFSLASPTATWWIQGRPEVGTSYGGMHQFADRRSFVDELLGHFAQYSFTVHGVTGEGAKVIVEATAEGQHGNGTKFHTEVILAFTVQEGKIQTVREWVDSKEVDAYLEKTARKVDIAQN